MFEAPHHQVGIDEWQQLEAPLVQIHTGVQAARLFVIDLSFACKRERVLGGRVRCEEPERVVVRAFEWQGFDDRVGTGEPESQRHRLVTDCVLAAAIDHRPFVEAEATQHSGPRRRLIQQIPHEFDCVTPTLQH